MSAHSSIIERGTIIADRYEIEKYLGESLLGPTYVVKTINNKKLLALKFIRKKYKRVEDEEEVLSPWGAAAAGHHVGGRHQGRSCRI